VNNKQQKTYKKKKTAGNPKTNRGAARRAVSAQEFLEG
jgi:hypothetical protein